MDIYTSILDYISNLPVLKAWREVKCLLNHAAVLKPRDWRLPIISSRAVGGSVQAAIPACAAIACAQVGIILIDDLLDDDPRGAYHELGVAQTANCAAGLLSLAVQAIYHSPALASVKLAADGGLSRMITTVAFGQYLDTQNSETEKAYWEVVQTKSAPFFSAVLELGALFGGSPMEVAHKIGNIGCLYGEMIQIHDDLNDCMIEPAGPDWVKGRGSLPILFTQTVDHPERLRFIELRKNISALEALREAQSILIRSGSISYSFHQLLSRYEAAQTILTSIDLADPQPLKKVLYDLISPVQKFLNIDYEPPI
jgi:geranylgeranyl pyrophosphate synthase